MNAKITKYIRNMLKAGFSVEEIERYHNVTLRDILAVITSNAKGG